MIPIPKQNGNRLEFTMSKFEQEHRYYVIKRKHLDGYSEAMVINLLEKLNLPELECVVVESDWPMYDDVWSMIKKYVESGNYISDKNKIQVLLHTIQDLLEDMK